MATTIKQRLGFMGIGLALALGACAPEDPPVNPSFAKDILPVMKAHCVRCHGANDKLNADPLSYPGSGPNKYNMPPVTGYLDSFQDKAGCVPTQTSFCAGAKTLAPSINVYVHFTSDLRMPPKPADPLSDWEIKLITNWTNETPPSP
jgi:mono/diheme cytochrome c family protein